MLIIIITVITQGARVPAEMRGDLKGLLFINSGFFQAVGVISFGKFRFLILNHIYHWYFAMANNHYQHLFAITTLS